MKRILRASTMTGGAAILSLLANALRVKIVAVLVGTAGLGVISYLYNLVQLAGSVTSLGINSGVVKVTSEAVSRGEEHAVDRIKATAIPSTFWFSVVIALALFAESRTVSIWLLGDVRYAFYVRLVSLGIPCLTLSQSLTAVLNGFKAIREIALISTCGGLIMVLLVAPLVWKYRLTGVVLHLVLQSMSMLTVTLLFYHRRIPGMSVLGALSFRGFDRRLVKSLAAFGVATFLLNVFQSSSFLIVRKLIQQRFGEHGVGLYQVPYGLTLQYLNIVLISLMTYSLPTMSALREESSLSAELNHTLRASLLAIVPIISVLLVLKRFLVLVLYSPQFLPSVNLLEIQLIGDFFKVIAYVFGVALLSRSRLIPWLVLDLFWDAIFIGLSYFLIDRVGLVGVAMAFLGAYFTISVGYVIFAWRSMKIHISGSNLKLILFSVIALASIVRAAHAGLPASIGIAGVVLLLWLVVCFKKSEIQKGLTMLRNLSWGDEKSPLLP
ncbi:MAG: oligosaccharide flippase family protein [Terriglobia bacterium]